MNKHIRKCVSIILLVYVMFTISSCGQKTGNNDGKENETIIIKNDYENEPVDNIRIVESDIDTWKEIGTKFACDIDFDYNLFSYNQDQLNADGENINDIVYKVNIILNSISNVNENISDLCSNPINEMYVRKANNMQIVYQQIFRTVLLSKTSAKVYVGTIYNYGDDSYSNTNEMCLCYELTKYNDKWKVWNVNDYCDINHNNQKLLNMGSHMVELWNDMLLPTPSGEKVKFIKIVDVFNQSKG